MYEKAQKISVLSRNKMWSIMCFISSVFVLNTVKLTPQQFLFQHRGRKRHQLKRNADTSFSVTELPYFMHPLLTI